MKKYSLIVILLNFVLCSSISFVAAQNNKDIYRRSVVSRTETWEPGRIDDTRHVIDSFFHENGVLMEVAESIINRERFRVIDSIPVNQRKFWDKEGHLVLEENFKEGKRVSVKSNYPSSLNLIPNGSFEQHSEIPPHIIEKNLLFTIRCQPIDSIIRIDSIYTYITGNDTTVHTLVTLETHSNCDLDYSKMIQRYVLIKKNGVVNDSILVNRPYFVHKGHLTIPKLHICNYEYIDIKVPGWESLGRQFPSIYNLEKNTPHSPLWGLADKVSYFNGVEGNSFLRLTSQQTNTKTLANCNIHYSHPLLQAKLNSTLIKGGKYFLEFWLWKPESYPEDQSLNIYFSEQPVTMYNFQNHLNRLITVEAFHDSTVHHWQKVSLSFKLPEFARYMTIGFFNPPRESSSTNHSDTILSTWCYIDAFVLVEEKYKDQVIHQFYPDALDHAKISTIDSSKMEFNYQKVNMETPIVLENILFEHDSFTLLPESHSAILNLVLFLEKHPNISIKISGHTDDSGSEEFNKQLSAKRAEAVVIKIIELGIDAGRLIWKGYGSAVPVTNNHSEEGRAKNRRVEFTVF